MNKEIKKLLSFPESHHIYKQIISSPKDYENLKLTKLIQNRLALWHSKKRRQLCPELTEITLKILTSSEMYLAATYALGTEGMI